MRGLAASALLAGALAAGAAAAPPRNAYTAAGNALARSISLKLSDVPAGWKTDATGSGGGSTTCKSFNPDQSDLTKVGHADTSFASVDGLTFAGSTIGVFASPGQAQTSWNRLVRPPMIGCLASLLAQGAASSGAKVTIVSKGKLSLRPEAPRAAAFRIVADVLANGQRVRDYLDVILQGRGAVDTVVLVNAVPKPMKSSLERRLAATVASRLPSH